jgi:hypothetical protein
LASLRDDDCSPPVKSHIENSIQAVRVALTESVLALAIAKGSIATASTLTLVKGTLKLMAWTKAKTAIVVGMVVLLAAGTPFVVKRVERARRVARLADWKANRWPEERRLEAERIKARQQFDETVNATTINLSPYITAKLTDGPLGTKGNDGDNLSELPTGRNIFAGIPFDVSGSVQLMGGKLKHFGKTYPAEVSDIRIDRKCTRLHLLHGDSDISLANFGTVVAKLVIHYTDGSSHELNLIAGEQSFDFWAPLFKSGVPPKYLRTAPGTERAWTGSNPYIRKWEPELSLVLYKTTFDNPEPEKEVSSVDYVSTETITCPFLLGLTVE